MIFFCKTKKQVSDKDAPGYSQIIKTKMALSIMKSKLTAREYSGGLNEFSDDVELIVQNCCTFNSFETVFYKVCLTCNEKFSCRPQFIIIDVHVNNRQRSDC